MTRKDRARRYRWIVLTRPRCSFPIASGRCRRFALWPCYECAQPICNVHSLHSTARRRTRLLFAPSIPRHSHRLCSTCFENDDELGYEQRLRIRNEMAWSTSIKTQKEWNAHE